MDLELDLWGARGISCYRDDEKEDRVYRYIKGVEIFLSNYLILTQRVAQ